MLKLLCLLSENSFVVLPLRSYDRLESANFLPFPFIQFSQNFVRLIYAVPRKYFSLAISHPYSRFSKIFVYMFAYSIKIFISKLKFLSILYIFI